MKRLWLPLAVCVAAISLNIWELAYRYPQLPGRVASHFNGAGQADGWMSKSQFASMWIGVLMVLAFGLGMTILITSVVPTSSFNLPNKDYWIAPERAAETRRMVVERILWFTSGLMLFVAYLSHKTLAFNLQPQGQMSVWTPLGIFLAFTAVWCGEMYWRFKRIPRSDIR